MVYVGKGFRAMHAYSSFGRMYVQYRYIYIYIYIYVRAEVLRELRRRRRFFRDVKD